MLRKYTGTWISTWSGNVNDPWHPLTHPGSVPSSGRLTYYNSLLIVHQQEAVFQPRSAGSWRLFWFPSLVSWYPEAVLVTQPRQLVAEGCSKGTARLRFVSGRVRIPCKNQRMKKNSYKKKFFGWVPVPPIFPLLPRLLPLCPLPSYPTSQVSHPFQFQKVISNQCLVRYRYQLDWESYT